MRKLVLLAAVGALILPVAALAKKPPAPPGQTTKTTTTTTTTTTSNNLPSPKSLAVQACKAERAQIGVKAFKQLHGANAYGKCVSQGTSSAQSDVQNASKTCKAEQKDLNFGPNHDGKTFTQFYAPNPKSNGSGAGKNAFGKCVSQHAKASTNAQTSAVVAAAKSCKSQRAADPKTFADTYKSKKNPFAACVSQTVKQ
jgi:hypothetical protein